MCVVGYVCTASNNLVRNYIPVHKFDARAVFKTKTAAAAAAGKALGGFGVRVHRQQSRVARTRTVNTTTLELSATHCHSPVDATVVGSHVLDGLLEGTRILNRNLSGHSSMQGR